MARQKDFTKSRNWQRAHRLNWLLRCTMGFRAILANSLWLTKDAPEIAADVHRWERMLGAIETELRLRIHEIAQRVVRR